MAVAELTQEYANPADAQESWGQTEGETLVRVGIHDASRIEWSVSVPLPTAKEGALPYLIDLEMEIPANAFARHSPWDQLQSFTRLDGPAEAMNAGDPVTIDGLRRGAIALANKLARAGDGFTRHCRLAASLLADAPAADLEDALRIWIDAAVKMAEEARKKVAKGGADDAAELVRERGLVDEYVSIRLLEMLAGVERALGAFQSVRAPGQVKLGPVVARVEAHVADVLEKEIEHRAAHRYLWADPDSLEALERYLDRASRLKKHFQEVLFLEPERYEVADRLHHWVAAFVAVLASTWAFIWQIVLINNRPTTGTQIGSGVVVLAVIAGLVYAAKDRIKEMGRTWISGNVHRFYAQRVARFRAPARRLPGRDVIVSARESIDQRTMQRPDSLNPESGATTPATIIKYTQKGAVSPQAQLTLAGVRRVKHVFRYDLSPLFARLDDALKPVPVLDAVTRRVKFADAPRCYRVPLRLKVTANGSTQEEEVTVVLHKRGLDRLERAGDTIRIEHDSAKDVGIEPG